MSGTATAPARKMDGVPHPPERIGYSYLHTAIDDHSRLAYSEICADETKESAVAFWARAQAWFTVVGVTASTQSGGCTYRRRTASCPLGMPTWSDKLAGEVVRLLQEACYESVFSGRSRGFRPGRGSAPPNDVTAATG